MFFGFITTNASLVALINSIVGGAGIALLVGLWLDSRSLAVALGVLGAALLMILFLLYQRWRYDVVGALREHERTNATALPHVRAVNDR